MPIAMLDKVLTIEEMYDWMAYDEYCNEHGDNATDAFDAVLP